MWPYDMLRCLMRHINPRSYGVIVRVWPMRKGYKEKLFYFRMFKALSCMQKGKLYFSTFLGNENVISIIIFIQAKEKVLSF